MTISRRLLKRILAVVFVTLTGGQGYQAYLSGVPIGDKISGIVTNVIDGDTLRINGIKMRLWGVDAPEKDQHGFTEATVILNQTAFLKKVTCTIMDRDNYGRLVTQCFKDRDDLAQAVIASGWAKDYHRHSKSYYLKDELAARKGHKGLWKS